MAREEAGAERPAGPVRIEAAGPESLPDVLALFEDAVGWLGRNGYDQWQYGWPDGLVAVIETGLAAGTTWLVRGGERVLATLSLDEHDERGLWPPEGSARYVYRLIVARAAAGCGLGSALLDWAGQRASAEGARWLRLDAWAGNADLHAYYLREGFQHVRTIESPAAKRGALFQRRAGERRNTRLVLTER